MRKGKSLFACGVAVVVTAAVLLIGVGPAFAAPPPFEPDPNAASPYGRIVFYDSLGNVLTGGTNLSHLADYAAATTTKDTGATLATLYFAAPDHTKVTSLWTAGQASGSTVFPNASAPVPIKGPGFANPLVTLDATAGDASSGNRVRVTHHRATGGQRDHRMVCRHGGVASALPDPDDAMGGRGEWRSAQGHRCGDGSHAGDRFRLDDGS